MENSLNFESAHYSSEDNNPVNDVGKQTDNTHTEQDSLSFDFSRLKSPDIALFINKCAEIVKTLGDVNDSLEYTTDAQTNLVQNFFTRKGVLVTLKQSKQKSSKKKFKKGGSNSSENQSKGSEQPVTQHVELHTEHLDDTENNTMESLQNSILKQAAMIRHSINELQAALESSMTQKFLESKASFSKRVFRVPENATERDVHIQVIDDYNNALATLRRKQAQIDTLNNQVKTLQHDKAKEMQILTEENDELRRKVADLEVKCKENKENTVKQEKELTLQVQKEANMIQCLQEKTAALEDERCKNNKNQDELNRRIRDITEKFESQVTTLEEDIKNKNSQIQTANQSLSEKDCKITEKTAALEYERCKSKKDQEELTSRITGITENLEGQVTTLEKDMNNKNSRIQTADQSLAEKNCKITEMTAALEDERRKNKENQEELNRRMIDKDREISDLRNRLNEMKQDLVDKVSLKDTEILNLKERIVSLEKDLVGKESAITELKETNCQQQSELDKQKTDLKCVYSNQQCLENAISNLQNDVKQSKEEISRLEKEDELSKRKYSELQEKQMKEVDISNDTINCLRGITKNLDSQVARLEEDNKNKNSEIQIANQTLADKDRKITYYCSQLSQSNNEKENQNKELQKYRAKIQNLTANITSLESEKKHLTSEKKTLNTELSEMRNDMSALDNKNTELEDRCSCLSNDLKEKDSQLKTLISESIDLKVEKRNNHKELNKLKEDVSQLINQNYTVKKKCSLLTSTVEKLKKEAATRDEELDMLRQIQREIEEEKERERMRRKVSAILYTPRRGDLLNAVVAELRERLISQFADQNADLTFQSAESASQIRTSMPVLVVCINASRLGTDVSNALSGVKANPSVAVVILHHKEIHALPNQSSERVLTSTEYKALGGIFDMACLSAKGLYPCDMNTNTLAGIVDFIKNNN